MRTQAMPMAFYRARAGESYSLLPFRFLPFEGGRYLLTNLVGEHLVLPRQTVQDLIRHKLPLHSEAYDSLKSRHFLIDADSTIAIDLLAAKFRTKLAFLSQFTSLFMFVTTLRCDHACAYCQVSSRRTGEARWDMTQEVADRAVEFMFRSPSPAIKIEFQGGESLLNFDIVKRITCLAEDWNQTEHRDLAFVLTTSLSALDDAALEFCRQHNIGISTSLDGPQELHNANRPRPDGDSYQEVVRGIKRAQEALGRDRISALMTTTKASLAQPEAIVDEYVRQGLSSIFLRPLNPYGRATSSEEEVGYSVEEWLVFYQAALAHILKLNRAGTPFREGLATLLLRKMLTPYATGYVDLQSPAGIGISGIILNYDGNVYPSDEARMLAEMGDTKFYMGNVLTDPYEKIMLSEALIEPLSISVAESVPQCADCAMVPYCGSDPIRHYRTQGDVVGHKPTSDFCRRNMGVMQHLLKLLEDDDGAAAVLRTWI